MSRYQKDKNHEGNTNLDLLEQEIVSGSGISCTICKPTHKPRQIPSQHPTTQFLQAACPFWRPTNSIKAHTHTHKMFYSSLDFIQDNPGQPVPEKTFTYSHLLWSSIIPYLLPPSITIHGVSGWMFLLVPAHPGCPGQNPESHKTVVCVSDFIEEVMTKSTVVRFWLTVANYLSSMLSCTLYYYIWQHAMKTIQAVNNVSTVMYKAAWWQRAANRSTDKKLCTVTMYTQLIS